MMKKLNIKFLAGIIVIFLATSCEDFLDVNENPNEPTTANVQLVLPNAIVASASVSNQFNSYGGHFGGFIANAGGFSGFGNLFSYNLTPNDWNALWTTTYQDPLADLKYVIDNSEGKDELSFYNAAANIMSVVNYQRLVDAFGNIPYSEALLAPDNNAPKYDDAATVYQALFARLDAAIDLIDAAEFPLELKIATDPLFGSNTTTERASKDQMLDWKRYANTLKLRILVRLSTKSQFDAFVATGFANLDLTFPATANASAGSAFLTDDAIVDPGYEKNRPNPQWNTWGKSPTDVLSNSSRVPTTFAFGFYNGKISDGGRGETIFVNFPTTPTNQLGNEVGNPTIVAGLVTWASNQAGLEGTGVLKGPGMGQPLMLAAEANFLLAEAQARGLLSGDAKASFNNGIKSSFAYLYKDANETMKDTTGLVANYLDNNDANDLVNFDLALTLDQKIEAIITQKYIALNFVNMDEAWNEYRRTGFPATSPGGTPLLDIASNKSTISSRTDRLPTRILYPSTEASFNASNFVSMDFTSDLIFWDPN